MPHGGDGVNLPGPVPAAGRDHVVVPLRLIAGLLLLGASHLLSALIVPFVLALVFAIALEPVVDRLVRRGIPNALASLAAMLAIAAALLLVVGLVLNQAGHIVRNSDDYLHGFGRVAARAIEATGSEGVISRLGVPPSSAVEGEPAPSPRTSREADWQQVFLRTFRNAGQWLWTGLGGLIGFVGSTVIFLAFLFYMLLTRKDWLDRLSAAMIHLGMLPRRRSLELIQSQIVRYMGTLGLVSLVYVVVISAALWLIGVPQPLLWGVLTGLLELIPYFGPVLAAALPSVVSLSGGSMWQPLAVIAVFVLLQTVEGYVVTPLLYGGAVELNPVTVLLGVLFFGWLWGPGGLIVAMPTMIILRGLLVIAPDTPALDALLEADKQTAQLQA